MIFETFSPSPMCHLKRKKNKRPSLLAISNSSLGASTMALARIGVCVAISSGRSAFATRRRQAAGRGFPEPLGNGARSFLARRGQIAILLPGRRPATNSQRPRQSGWDRAQRGAIRVGGGTGRQQGTPTPGLQLAPQAESPDTCG